MSRSDKPRPSRRRWARRWVQIELLEQRCLLTAELTSSGLASLSLNPDAYAGDSILVRFQDASTSANVQASEAGGVSAASILPGSRSQSIMQGLPALQRVELPPNVAVADALAAFRNRPEVMYAEPNYRLQTSVTPNDSRFAEMWGLENTAQTGGVADADIDAAGAWDVNTGSGSLVVAVIDTGVQYTHADLAANMWTNPFEIPGDGIDNDGNSLIDDYYGYDFANNDGDPMDDNGHGTHVAGTIGAVGDNGLGVTGINWDIQIMALKFLGADGSGTSDAAIEAISYAVAHGAQISNNSWGGDPYSQAMFDVIAAARSQGHLFVAASGNGNAFGVGLNNDVNPFYPAGYELDNVLAVAAVDHRDQLASFANFGASTVDLAAPGVNILSTTNNGGYGLSSGTSMASPHVAGAAALVWDAHSDWDYSQVIAKLLDSVDPLPSLQGLLATGGRLNLASALDNPQPPPPPPPPGSLPLVEDLQDNQAEYFDPQSGNWSVQSGRFTGATPADDDQLASIATLRFDAPLPDDFEMQATINADEGRLEFFGIVLRDHLTNGFLIFDYEGPQDFKFAGPDMDQDRWVMGRRDATGWHVDAWLGQTLSAATNYDVKLVIEGAQQATLFAGGAPVLTHGFAESVTDGDAGVGGRNSTAHFDNIVARVYQPPVPGSLPLWDDLEDGAAEHLVERNGVITVNDGRLQLTPSPNSDGVATFLLSETLPGELELSAVFNADDTGPGRLSNAFLIFDYHGPTDFKFAGAYAGVNQWLIGRRTTTDWVADAVINASIDALADYEFQVTLTADSTATLKVNGVERLSYQFGDSLTDGELGLGVRTPSLDSIT